LLARAKSEAQIRGIAEQRQIEAGAEGDIRERENADADGRNRQREAGADPRPRSGGRTMSR